MSFSNDCRFVGNLGADPEIKSLQNGDKVCNLRIAVSERWRDKNTGEQKERTEWIPIVIWNEGLISVVERFCQKGDTIGVSGEFQTRKWQDQSGNDRYSTEIVLQRYRGEIKLLRTKGSDQANGQTSYGSGSSSGGGYGGHADLEDEIPF